MIKSILISLLTFSLFISCNDNKPVNLSIAKEQVKEYYNSKKINKEIKGVVDDAISQLENIKLDEHSAIVFDIDETTLSGYDYALQLDFGYDWDSWTKWQLEAKAPAIEEVKALYDHALKKNIHVIFLTGKRNDTYGSTYKNLVNVGYTKFDTLICRQENEFNLKANVYKTNHRKALTEAGYKIVMCVGDQMGDLDGEYTGIKVMIPNYLYLLD